MTKPKINKSGDRRGLCRTPKYDTHMVCLYDIISRYGKKLKLTYSGGAGYATVRIDGENIYHHRLIAKEHIPNPDNLPNVNHIDGDCTNNRIDNLEWCTQSHNVKHAHDIGLNKGSGKPIRRSDGKEYASAAAANREEGYRSKGSISQALTGRTKTAYGYTWEFV